MKLRTLELDQFKKFDRPCRVGPFADGLNLIAGPNEMGKSTLLAALRAVLFERHRSIAQSVKSLQPSQHEGTAPEVALDFELAGAPYRIEKRFLRRPRARLTLPDGRRVEGDAAEERLRELLGMAPFGGRGLDEGADLWGILWVAQGQSFHPPELTVGTRSTLQAALEVEVEYLTGGDHGQRLITATENALHELVDRRGKPRQRYKSVAAELDASAAHITQLERQRAELEQEFAELDERQRELDHVTAEQAESQDEALLTAAIGRQQELMRISAADNAVELAGHRLNQIEAEQRQRQDRHASIETTKAAVQAAEIAAAEAARLLGETEVSGQERRAALEQVEQQQNAANRRLHLLEQLRRAMQERRRCMAGLEASAIELAFELDPDAVDRVSVGEMPLPQPNHVVKLVDPTAITIAGVGRIGVRSRSEQQAQLRSDRAAAEREIERLSGELGDDSDRATLDAQWETTTAELQALAERVRSARSDLEAARELWYRHNAEHEQGQGRAKEMQDRLAGLERDLAAAEREASPTDLAARLDSAKAELERASAARAELGPQQPSESTEDLGLRIEQLRQAIDARNRRRAELEVGIERLRAWVQVRSGEGIDERLGEAERRHAELERERAKYQRDAEVLTLLRDTLVDGERSAKERYLRPLTARIQPYLQALLPGAEVTIDRSFGIAAVKRSAAGIEAFDQLSDGTQEQIAVLTRLAFAEMLHDRGLPAVVVLDDALVFADDRRLESMFQILERAAQKLQIIVLTCREQLFEGLPATRLGLETTNPEHPAMRRAAGTS